MTDRVAWLEGVLADASLTPKVWHVAARAAELATDWPILPTHAAIAAAAGVTDKNVSGYYLPRLRLAGWVCVDESRPVRQWGRWRFTTPEGNGR